MDEVASSSTNRTHPNTNLLRACRNFQGIFGIAFKGLDEYYDAGGYESRTTYADAKKWCEEAKKKGGGDGRHSDPLLGDLMLHYRDGARIFGIHYSGILPESKCNGTRYMGPSARKTSLYDPRNAQVPDLYDAAGVVWGDRAHLFGNQGAPTPGASTYAQGILDTGTPALEVPQSILDSMYSDLGAARGGTLSMILEPGV